MEDKQNMDKKSKRHYCGSGKFTLVIGSFLFSFLFLLSYPYFIDCPANYFKRKAVLIFANFDTEYSKKLDLGNTWIKDVPESIYELKKLEYLDLSNNPFNKLSEKISQLSNLKVLLLNKESVPSIFFEDPYYRHGFDEIPKGIFNLKKLERLDLSSNRIHIIPLEIRNLTNLRKLILKENDILIYPELFRGLNKLELLDLRGNYITKDKKNKLSSLLPDCKILFDED